MVQAKGVSGKPAALWAWAAWQQVNCISLGLALLLCAALVFSLWGCAASPSTQEDLPGTPGLVWCTDDEYSAYSEALSRILPAQTVRLREGRPFDLLAQGAAVEAFDVQAIPALAAGVAKYWYPHFLATVVFAIDRSRTDANISAWRDLPNAGEAVGMSTTIVNSEMLMGALAYGLEGEAFTLGEAVKLLAALGEKGQLIEDSFAPPVLICFDYQAAEMARRGLAIETILPAEGTLVYEKGLLSNTPLVFSDDAEAVLLSAGFRLPDGRANAGLYHDAEAYAGAVRIMDYGHFAAVGQDTIRLLRQDVLRIRLYSSKDGRQHQLFVLVFMIFIIAWTSSVLYRVLRKGVRQAVCMTAILLLGWSIVRLLKYQIAIAGTAERYLWYGYYLFQLALPLVLLWLAHMIGQGDARVRAPIWFRVLAVWNGLVFLLVFTNDLHFLTFTLDPGNPNWPTAYGYGAGYYLSLASCFLTMLAGLALLLIKSRGNMRKRGLVFPIAFISLLAAYSYGYVQRIPLAHDSDMAMVIGVFTFLMYETIIRIGLIPVNGKYKAFFTHSPLGIRIADKSGAIALQSAAAAAYAHDKELFSHALASFPAPVQKDEDTLVFASGITGGFVLWHEDITDLNRLHREMKESVQNLEAANAVLAEEEKIRRTIDAENARTQLMTQLEAEIASHSAKLKAMIEELEMTADKGKATARIMLLLCYLKRRCNLFFREKEIGQLPQGEFAMYFDEIAEIASYAQVQAIVTGGLSTGVSVRCATLLYDFFYSVIYWATWLCDLKILAFFATEGGRVVLRLLPSADAHSFQMEKGLETAIEAAGGIYTAKDIDDETVGLTLSFPGGGEAHD